MEPGFQNAEHFKDEKTIGNSMSFLKSSDIKLMLEGYDDIFSDFDPREFSQRSLSVDFLEEAQRASIDKEPGHIELNLLVPKAKRSKAKEEIIKSRLKDHFRKHYHELNAAQGKVKRNGYIFMFFGVLAMISAVLVHWSFKESILTDFLIVLFEPAGWFLFWEGLDLIIFESKKISPKLEFYKKMNESYINFNSY